MTVWAGTRETDRLQARAEQLAAQGELESAGTLLDAAQAINKGTHYRLPQYRARRAKDVAAILRREARHWQKQGRNKVAQELRRNATKIVLATSQ
jgi:hypothetical protein